MSSGLCSNRWFPPPKFSWHPAKHNRCESINAMLYADGSGITRRALPQDFPLWHTVYHDFCARRGADRLAMHDRPNTAAGSTRGSWT